MFASNGILAADHSDRFESHVYRDADNRTLPYCLLSPKDYDPARKYPLVLFFTVRASAVTATAGNSFTA